MDWHDRIIADADTLSGKPRIKGTRISVDLILDRLADGWSEADIFESYPRVTQKDLQAVFAFVRDRLRDETYIMNGLLKSAEKST